MTRLALFESVYKTIGHFKEVNQFSVAYCQHLE